jgi:spermidine/putrescine transport system substrate-binding protein
MVPDWKNYTDDWSIFAQSKYKDRMTMLDDMREVMGDALVQLGYSVNSTDPAQIDAARDLINKQWKPNLTKFDAEAFGKGYARGDYWAVQGYAEVVAEEIADDPALKSKTVFFIPKKGGPSYIDSMCILKGSKHQDLALKFIDFILQPEIYAEFCDTFGFPSSVNVPARKFVKGPSLYTVDALKPTELKMDLSQSLELYNKAWYQNIRIGD